MILVPMYCIKLEKILKNINSFYFILYPQTLYRYVKPLSCSRLDMQIYKECRTLFSCSSDVCGRYLNFISCVWYATRKKWKWKFHQDSNSKLISRVFSTILKYFRIYSKTNLQKVFPWNRSVIVIFFPADSNSINDLYVWPQPPKLHKYLNFSAENLSQWLRGSMDDRLFIIQGITIQLLIIIRMSCNVE